MKRSGIIFDLDGTLWEVTDRTFEGANEVARKHELQEISIETIRRAFGGDKLEVTKIYFPELELNKGLRILEEISDLVIKKLREYGGNIYQNVKETLMKLKENYDLFIVSNTTQKKYIEAFLISTGVSEYFKGYIAASELNISKADAIKKVMIDNSLEKSVYVGDTKKDLESAEAAQIPFIHAKYGYENSLQTRYSIDSMEELPSIIEMLFNS